MPRRSKWFGATLTGDGFCSLAGVLLRESQEKGIVSFLAAGGAWGGVVDVFIGFAGGGPHGMEGKEPERPDREEGIGAAGE